MASIQEVAGSVERLRYEKRPTVSRGNPSAFRVGQPTRLSAVRLFEPIAIFCNSLLVRLVKRGLVAGLADEDVAAVEGGLVVAGDLVVVDGALLGDDGGDDVGDVLAAVG